MKVVLDENGFWWKWVGWKWFWWKWILMKMDFDESGFWWKWFLMKVVFDEKWQFHPILTPNRTCTHGTEDLEDYHRLASLAARSHFPASSIRSFSICPKLLLEWDEIQKLLAHTMLHIWCAFSLRRPAGRPCFLVHVSSTLAQSCVATIWHNRGASPVPHCHVWTWELSLLVIPTLQTFFTILLHLTSPRHVFASVNIHISPRRLICIMNPIFRAIFGLSLTVHGEAFVLDVIWDSGDVAHVVVTTTLQALDCLWLEKMLHTHA